MKRIRGDQGNLALSLIVVVTVLMLISAITATGLVSINKSRDAKYLVGLNQMRDLAVQDAINVLSTTDGQGISQAGYTKASNTGGQATGSGAPTLRGLRGSSWSWKATSATSDGKIQDCTNKTLDFPPTIDAKRIVATGRIDRLTNGATSLDRCFLVYGVRGEPDVNRQGTTDTSDDVYTGTVNISPNSVFGHVLFGTSGVRFDGTAVSGSIGASSDVNLSVLRNRITNNGIFLYPAGPDLDVSTCTNAEADRCDNVHSFAQRAQLDVTTVDDLASKSQAEGGAGCADEATDPYAVNDNGVVIDLGSTIKAFETTWVASQHPGGVLDLSNGAQQCYKNLVFDTNTVVIGRNIDGVPTGNVFATGNVDYRAGASVNSADFGGVGTTKLAVYAIGNLDSRVTFAVGGGTSRVSAFVYAPRANCEAPEGGTAARNFRGSLACRVVDLRDDNMTVTGATVRPGDPFNYYTGYYPIWYPEQNFVSAP